MDLESKIKKPLFPVRIKNNGNDSGKTMDSERSPTEMMNKSAVGETTSVIGLNHAFPVNVNSDSHNCIKDQNLDWLDNNSFTASSYSAYKSLQSQVEEEKKRLQKHTHVSETVKGDKDSKSDINYVSSDSDTGTSSKHHQSKDKKKKKKKKHKKERKRLHSPEFPSDFKRLKFDDGGFDFGPGKIFLEEIPAEVLSNHSFKFDRKRDKNLWTYESLAKQHISHYKSPWKRCLGLNSGQKLISTDKQQLSDKQHAGLTRYYGKTEIKIIRQKGLKVLADKSTLTDDLKRTCLPLLKDRSCTVGNIYNPLGILDTATSNYISGKGPEQKSETITDVHDQYMKQAADYNKRLQESPGNVDLWLEYVKFQDKLFEAGDSVNFRFRSDFASSLAAIEKRLAIFEKALENNPSSLKLKLAQIETGQDIWDAEKVKKEWDQLLFLNAGNITMWRHYLLKEQCNLSSFKVSKIIALYHKCFKMVISVLEGKVKTIQQSNDTATDLLELFIQYCRFLQQAGLKEKAIASFQALIEFNLFCPPQYKDLDTVERIAMFESFWDSNVARFGEDNSKGWKYWVANNSSSCIQTTSNSDYCAEVEDAIIKSTNNKHEAWMKIESLRESNCLLPWKADISKDETEDDCSDFERLVLFDDISPTLFELKAEHPLLQLILAFLDALGFSSSEWHTEVLGVPIPKFKYKSDFQQMWLCQIQQIPECSNIATGVNVKQTWQPSLILRTLITNILNMGPILFPINNYSRTILALLRIQFECGIDNAISFENLPKVKAKELKKSLKRLLKDGENRNNLIVWNIYTKVELALGKREDALKIVQTSLAMYDQNCSTEECVVQKLGLYSLYITYCEILLNFNISSFTQLNKVSQFKTSNENHAKVIHAMKCLSENHQFNLNELKCLSGGDILRVRKKFKTMIDYELETVNNSTTDEMCFLIHSLVRCAALFEYVTVGIEKAVSIFSNTIEKCDSIYANEEVNNRLKYLIDILYRNQHQLILNHMTSSVMPLELLRTCLSKSLDNTPNEPNFLRLLIEVECRSHISRNLRKYFDRSFKNLTTPIPVVFAVISEMARQEILHKAACSDSDATVMVETGISHRIRSLFDKSLQHSCCKHCPLIWRLYIAYEVKMGKLDRAKGLFYKSLQLCPSTKVLYTDAVGYFGDSILQEIVDLMTEKELRVHLPLEEMDILMNSDPL
ncbi:hypothetical protein SNE40_008946 [Patella caerulea]|uniref:Protein NRDE2 homolog n=1 Tax=Patella caerulea TaxID=87958 RepID=A0AAN8JQ66_PATCE